MKTFSILLLTVMIAIFAEKYMAKYLLVEIDQPEGEVNPNEDNGSGSISARGSTVFELLNLLISLLKHNREWVKIIEPLHISFL